MVQQGKAWLRGEAPGQGLWDTNEPGLSAWVRAAVPRSGGPNRVMKEPHARRREPYLRWLGRSPNHPIFGFLLGTKASSSVLSAKADPGPEEGLNEPVEVAIQDGARVAGLELGAVVLDHLVGVEDVGTDLATPFRLDVVAFDLGQGFLLLLAALSIISFFVARDPVFFVCALVLAGAFFLVEAFLLPVSLGDLTIALPFNRVTYKYNY